ARARARERRGRQRHLVRPLGWALIAIVVTTGLNSSPAPGLTGARLGVSLALAVYAVAVAATVAVAWARRGHAAQLALIGLIGGCGVALAARAGGTARAGPTVGGWLVELEVPGGTPLRRGGSGS